MNDLEIKNAIITDASLTTEDHGVLSGWVYLDYGGSGQGFGGYVLAPSPKSPHYPGPNAAGVWVWRVMQAAGVSKWADLKGKTVRVKSTHSSVTAIGHIVRDDRWFSPRDEFAAMEPRKE